MSKNIYCGNLSYQATEDEVRELFERYGTVERLAMINDRETGNFRGFCFVEMPDEEADVAIAALNGMDFGGRNLRVNETESREQRRGGGGNRGGGGRGGGYRGGGNRGGGNRGGGNRGGGRGGYDRDDRW